MKTFVALSLASVATGAYVWPSKWDELEDLMSLHSGYSGRGFSDSTEPCTFGEHIKGRQNAAEWIRTSFHDMITYDAEAGTGGLDGSIWFESSRPENPGLAFNNTYGFFSGYYTVRTSMADLLALGMYTALGSCGGPKVDVRGGRIDAHEAGPAGVPEPQTDLATTVARYKKAGFSTEDMIASIACGHSLGGVHSLDFFDITGIPATTYNDTTVQFQSNVASFHNGIVTEYLDGNSTNPLVVAPNATFHSDKRIFEADGNKTMSTLVDTDTYQSVCRDILTRMIETVPRDVHLTDVIEPVDVKPYVKGLYLNYDGNLTFSGEIRLRTTGGIRNTSDLSVGLTYADRSGRGQTAVATQLAPLGGITAGLYRENFVSFLFNATVNPDAGISKFWIHETVPSTNKTITHDNSGTGGYPVDDAVLYQSIQSCRTASELSVVAMVRKEHAFGQLALDVVQHVPQPGSLVPRLETESVKFSAPGEERSGWIAYQAKANISASTTFDIVLNGGRTKSVEFLKTQDIQTFCQA